LAGRGERLHESVAVNRGVVAVALCGSEEENIFAALDAALGDPPRAGVAFVDPGLGLPAWAAGAVGGVAGGAGAGAGGAGAGADPGHLAAMLAQREEALALQEQELARRAAEIERLAGELRAANTDYGTRIRKSAVDATRRVMRSPDGAPKSDIAALYLRLQARMAQLQHKTTTP
jgi:hypothetical protein